MERVPDYEDNKIRIWKDKQLSKELKEQLAGNEITINVNGKKLNLIGFIVYKIDGKPALAVKYKPHSSPDNQPMVLYYLYPEFKGNDYVFAKVSEMKALCVSLGIDYQSIDEVYKHMEMIREQFEKVKKVEDSDSNEK